jgi:hypothetical protein
MTAKQKLLESIKEKETEINNFEIDPENFESQYDDMLDEISTIKIGSLTYSASYVLKNIDPTAYRCGLLDYIDGIDKDEIPAFQELIDELQELIDKLEELEKESKI